MKSLSKDTYKSIDGKRTHYIEAGPKSQTLFLIHGGNLLGCAEINWGGVIPLFSASFHVLAADQIGFGRTDPPKSDFSLKARGDHLISLLDSLGESNVHVVGNSQGGWLGIYIALKRPDLVRKLVIVNSGSASWKFTQDVEKQFPSWFTGHMTPPTIESVKAELYDMTFHENLITSDLIDMGLTIATLNFETHKQRMESTHSTWEKANENHSLDGKHISEYVNQLRIPVLLMWGSRDHIAPLEKGVRLFEQIRGAELHVFDEAKHHVMVDQQARFVSLVTDFLRD